MYSAPSPCSSAQPSYCILDVLSICLVGMTSLIRCCVCERRWTLILLQQSSVCMRAQHPGADRRHSVQDAASTHPVSPKLSVQFFCKLHLSFSHLIQKCQICQIYSQSNDFTAVKTLPPVGLNLMITGSRVECLSNCANLAFLDPYIVML